MSISNIKLICFFDFIVAIAVTFLDQQFFLAELFIIFVKNKVKEWTVLELNFKN